MGSSPQDRACAANGRSPARWILPHATADRRRSRAGRPTSAGPPARRTLCRPGWRPASTISMAQISSSPPRSVRALSVGTEHGGRARCRSGFQGQDHRRPGPHSSSAAPSSTRASRLPWPEGRETATTAESSGISGRRGQESAAAQRAADGDGQQRHHRDRGGLRPRKPQGVCRSPPAGQQHQMQRPDDRRHQGEGLPATESRRRAGSATPAQPWPRQPRSRWTTPAGPGTTPSRSPAR